MKSSVAFMKFIMGSDSASERTSTSEPSISFSVSGGYWWKLNFRSRSSFDGKQIGFDRIDRFVNRRVIVEVKSTHKLVYADRMQLMNYVTAMNLEVGLLLHFGPRPAIKRVLGGWKPASRVAANWEREPAVSPEVGSCRVGCSAIQA